MSSENINSRDFERDWNRVNFPFQSIVGKNDNLRQGLFEEFCQTERIPCINLYWNNFYTEEQIHAGFEEDHSYIPIKKNVPNGMFVCADFVRESETTQDLNRLRVDFYELLAGQKLPKKFYRHTITKTETFETLSAIQKVIDDLENIVIGEFPTDPVSLNLEAGNVSKKLVELLHELKYKELADSVFNAIISNDENMTIASMSIAVKLFGEDDKKFKAAYDKYRRLRMYFVNKMKELYLGVPNGAESNPGIIETAGIDVAEIKSIVLDSAKKVEDSLTILTTKPAQKKSAIRKPAPILSFKDVCKNEDAFISAKDALANQRLIDKTTKRCTNQSSDKTNFVAALRYLEQQGYYKNGIKITDKNYLRICFDEFGLTVSKNTVKNSKPQKFTPVFSIPQYKEVLL